MAPEAVAAESAYLRLKRDVVSGRYPPATRIVERVLAREYGVSIVPFRDAAQRLVGEQLLEAGPGGGYRIPAISEEGLRDLYSWHSHLVRLALKAPAIDLNLDPAVIRDSHRLPAEEIANSASELFRAIALRSENGEVARTLLAVNDRLHPIRLREREVLGNLGAELQAIMIATVSGQGLNRFTALWAYHRRRIRRVTALAQILGRLNKAR